MRFRSSSCWNAMAGASERRPYRSGAADLPQCVLVTLVALFVIWKHRSNIKRLATGCESKIYLFGRRKDG